MNTRLAALLLVLWTSSPSAAAVDPAVIDTYVTRKMHDHLVPGLALVVVSDGQVTHQRGFGAMDASSAIVIGSLSKAVTATAVLQLLDAGKVQLDQPVRRYLPDFQLAGGAAEAITVRHLLNQTSGLPMTAARAGDGDASLAEHVAALRDVHVTGPAGVRHVYSSPNYQVLGRLVEVVSGEAFGAYVQRHVFEPLKMTSSGIEPGAVPGLVPGHNVWWGLTGPGVYRFERGRLPTASLISSAPDLARFVRAHLNGGELDGVRILSAEATATAHRGVVPADGFGYAMGWREGTTAGVPSLWHGGALACYRGAIVMLPQSRSAVVVLTSSSSMFTDHTREIAAGVVALMEGRPTPSGIKPLREISRLIAIGSAALLLLGAFKLWRAARGPRLAAGRSLVPVIAFDLLLPLALVVLIPLSVHVSWGAMFEGAPDLVVTSALLIVMGVVTGLLKLARRERSTV